MPRARVDVVRTSAGLALALAAVSISCAGGDGTPRRRDPPPPAVCTGAVPDHATLCPGSDEGLTADAPRVLLSGACPAGSSAVPCAYACDAPFVPDGDVCDPGTVVHPPAVVTDGGDGTVTVEDGLGVYVWLKDAHCTEAIAGIAPSPEGSAWWEAMDWVTALGDGHCGLSDGSAPGEWVLPDPPALAHVQAAIASGAFVDVVDTFYWTDYWLDDFCGAVFMPAGNMELRGWAEQHLAWPVRLR